MRQLACAAFTSSIASMVSIKSCLSLAFGIALLLLSLFAYFVFLDTAHLLAQTASGGTT